MYIEQCRVGLALIITFDRDWCEFVSWSSSGVVHLPMALSLLMFCSLHGSSQPAHATLGSMVLTREQKSHQDISQR
jgi:hypothetical protein